MPIILVLLESDLFVPLQWSGTRERNGKIRSVSAFPFECEEKHHPLRDANWLRHRKLHLVASTDARGDRRDSWLPLDRTRKFRFLRDVSTFQVLARNIMIQDSCASEWNGSNKCDGKIRTEENGWVTIQSRGACCLWALSSGGWL